MNYYRNICLLLVSCFAFSQTDKQISFRELTVEQGLSQNSVVSIAQDSVGYMWFATQDGLNKYDGRTFKVFNRQFEDVTRPTYSKLGKIYVDKNGSIWIISNSGVLEKFDSNSNTFSKTGISNASTIIQNSDLDFYIGTYGEGLYKIAHNPLDTLKVFQDIFKPSVKTYDMAIADGDLFLATSNGIFKITDNTIKKIAVENEASNFSAISIANDGTVWVGSFEDGLFYKPSGTEKLIAFKQDRLPSQLNIQDLLVDKNNVLWIATYGRGLYIFDKTTQNVTHFIENKDDPYALHYDDVLSLYQDFTGTIWLGTDGAGLSYYDQHLFKFKVINNEQTPSNVNVDVIRSIALDQNRSKWLGTSGKGLTMISDDGQTYKTYTTDNSDLKSNRIMSLFHDGSTLWIGHQGRGLQRLNSSGSFQNVKDLSTETIWRIYPESSEQLWICTRDNGLLLFDKTKGVVKRFSMEDSILTTNNIRTVEKGASNQLWIGTEDKGLFLMDTNTNIFHKIEAVPEKIKSLYYQNKTLWIGTNGSGLKSFETIELKTKTYTLEDGLPNNVIYGILPDDRGNLWLSSNKGISRFSLKSNNLEIENYSNYNGLQAFEFNTGAYFKDQNGTLYFGGLEGLNWFKPDELSYNSSKPKTVISKLEVFGKEQELKRKRSFKYNQNTMTFTFAGLHFSQPERNQYKYKLVNHDQSWVEAENMNMAHYTNLPPDDYRFEVISSNYDGVWNKEPATYKFTILKPWYLTNTLKVIYVLLFLCSIFAIYKYLEFRWKLQIQFQLEHAETERLKKLDEFKTKLYTNISHEFRTPLTLISGPIDHQLSKKDLSSEDQKELSLIKQNANRLLSLVNQMVDLSLIDSGQLHLQVSQDNLSMLLTQIIAAFQYKAQEENIELVSTIQNLDQAWFDHDIIEKITSNLLSNAIKYAPTGSRVNFDANRVDEALIMSVVNVNTRVSRSDFEQLFKRFYQEDASSDGVGVGLALVKELVNACKGSIIANTLDDQKIQFTVTLPITKEAFPSSQLKMETKSIELSDWDEGVSVDECSILIVEDNQELRAFIVTILRDCYHIIEATNGKEGVEKAIKYVPDIIISDIMMPIEDGIYLCNQLKFNELTSHIPIILLTAKVGEKNEIEGLKTGADAYMTKPFHSEKLKLRVRKLIENRRQLQKHYGQDLSIDPKIAITSTEAQFLKRLKSVLDQHVTNPEFTSEFFSESMQMSRTQLHRKLKAIVGMTSSEFIRSERLKLAIQLLKKSDATVSEVAYKVGFNTPSYFIKCFKEAYHCTPKEFTA